jgi:gluconolactonase
MHPSLASLKIEVDMLAPGAERIVGKDPPLDIIARNVIFGEGPVWDAANRQFFFTDIIGDTIWKWRPRAGLKRVLRPSAKANGLALDRENRLVVAGWGGRTVFRFERDGSRTTLAARWEGKKLNSPNDIVVKSDGSVWFTDPPGGLLNVGMVADDLQKYLDVQGVFRIARRRATTSRGQRLSNGKASAGQSALRTAAQRLTAPREARRNAGLARIFTAT